MLPRPFHALGLYIILDDALARGNRGNNSKGSKRIRICAILKMSALISGWRLYTTVEEGGEWGQQVTNDAEMNEVKHNSSAPIATATGR